MLRLLSTVSVFLFVSTALAATTIPTCGPGNLCPSSLPCCSQYGQCGVGAYCLGGCDPMYSNTLNSCTPAPICKSVNYKMTNLDGITPNTEYLGDATKSHWVSSGNPVPFKDTDGSEQVLLTMAKGTVGTLLASTAYVWYGKISATMKTSRTAGVVTAFILLSDVKDEIDFEFVGSFLDDAQSNFYHQAIPNYTNEKNLSVTDTFGTYHTYEIDWTPDTVTWSIDGVAGRTLQKSSTWNSTSNSYHYPQTPARVQLSLWPAGQSTNGKGTVDWAGGLIDWSSPDVANAGYFYAMVNEVNVQCYSPPAGASVTGTNAYIYNNLSGLNNTVLTTGDNTVLASNIDTGLDMSANAATATAPGASASAVPSDIPTVPGLSGVGTGNSGQRGDGSGAPGSVPSSTPGSSSPPGSGTTPQQPGTSGYSGIQGLGTPSGTAPPKGERAMQGSMLAVLVAILGLMVL